MTTPWQIYWLAGLLFIAGGCNQTPAKPEINLIADQDGCKVYEVCRQGYHNVYFTNCQGNTSWQEHHGKTSHPVTNQTSVIGAAQ